MMILSKNIILLFFFISFFTIASESQPATTINKIPTPPKYTRLTYKKSTYSNFITNLPLKKNNTIKSYKNEDIDYSFYNIFAVIKMPLLFNQDLEQCADFSFRFRAEYFKKMNKLSKLYLFDYNGRKKYLINSRKKYKNFLKWSMVYANSYSIKKGCRKVNPSNLRPGDMIVQNTDGGIGHVSIIMDVCKNSKGKKLYLIGYSFMPAQEFHIEKADDEYGKKGWFSLEGYYRYLAKHLDYGKPVLRRF